jgi:ankyrin repeat protein
VRTTSCSCTGPLSVGTSLPWPSYSPQGATPIFEVRTQCKTVRFRINNCRVTDDTARHLDSALNTPLHFAADRGFSAIARLLLLHGADASARDEDGNTPLMLAQLCDRDDTAALLLAHSTSAQEPELR